MNKNRIVLFLVVFFSCLGQMAFVQDPMSIGILDIVPGEGISIEETEYVTRLLYGYAVSYSAEDYTLIDNESLDRILLENQLDIPYVCAESSCACSVGALLAADYMIVGTLGVVLKRGIFPLFVKSQLLRLDKINVKTGESELSLNIVSERTWFSNPLERQLKYPSRALFSSREQRERNYRSQLLTSVTTAAIGVPLLLGGLIAVGIIVGVIYLDYAMDVLFWMCTAGNWPINFGNIKDENVNKYLLWGIPCLTAGIVLDIISINSLEKARFWKSTISDD